MDLRLCVPRSLRRITRPLSRTLSTSSATTPPPSITPALSAQQPKPATSNNSPPKTPSLIPNAEPLPPIPQSILDKTQHRLHLNPSNPLNHLKTRIESHFRNNCPHPFTFFDNLPPQVTTDSCFDHLLVPFSHPSRSPTDTYYISPTQVLRPHMTAHDVPFLQQGLKNFVVTGDVYRRDTIDKTHYPVFHQVDGVCIFDNPDITTSQVIHDLKSTLEGLTRSLFGQEIEIRWVDAYFPFTTPSFEMEILWKKEWLEILGCGPLQREVLRYGGVGDEKMGWAFGMGLERLAMVLYNIPDIRLFWSEDKRFYEQFKGKESEIVEFKVFSEYPPTVRDVAFWMREGDEVHENLVCEIVRGVAGDVVEDIERIDEFRKGGKVSHCYRITYRHMSRTLKREEATDLHERIKIEMEQKLPIELRG